MKWRADHEERLQFIVRVNLWFLLDEPAILHSHESFARPESQRSPIKLIHAQHFVASRPQVPSTSHEPLFITEEIFPSDIGEKQLLRKLPKLAQGLPHQFVRLQTLAQFVVIQELPHLRVVI